MQHEQEGTVRLLSSVEVTVIRRQTRELLENRRMLRVNFRSCVELGERLRLPPLMEQRLGKMAMHESSLAWTPISIAIEL